MNNSMNTELKTITPLVNYTNSTVSEIKDVLLKLKEMALNNTILWKTHGICSNLSDLLLGFAGYDIVSDNCIDWEYYSGVSYYPIPLEYSGDLWEGKQLEYRLSLIDHLIKKCDLDLESE